ncbi:MAG: type II toxin-antitoxin system VapC family toxin [Stellaceae bacterium]
MLRGRGTPQVTRLLQLIDDDDLLIGDLILLEVLQGARNELAARQVEEALLEFPTVRLFDPAMAISAAANYRFLRSRGITIRKTIDLIIGTFCIERGHSLLHSDRDFEPMERLLGLQQA